jgi:multiple sugar transport system permease protein
MKPEELQKKKAAQLNQDDPLYYLKVIGRYFKKNWEGLLYVTPVILGILFFTVLPMVTSMYDSFFKYDGITEREWNNFRNYIRPFTDDWDVFGKSLGVTFLYSFINIPLTMSLSFLLALFLNKKRKGIKVF